MTPRDQADERIAQVRVVLRDAIAKWSGWRVSLGSYFGTPQDQVLSALRQIESGGVVPWEIRASKLAQNDADGWARWVRDGTDLKHNLETTAQDAQTGDLAAIIVETVKASAVDVRETAVSVWSARRWIVAGLVAVAVVAVVVWLLVVRG